MQTSDRAVAATELVPFDDPDACRAVGNRWFDEGTTAVLWVPSVVSPHERNVLINQMHPDFPKVEVSRPIGATIDKRPL